MNYAKCHVSVRYLAFCSLIGRYLYAFGGYHVVQEARGVSYGGLFVFGLSNGYSVSHVAYSNSFVGAVYRVGEAFYRLYLLF